jgi:hypothetical protein
MTLGGLIKKLESFPHDKKIQGLTEPHSYRGYYSDLAFEPSGDPVLVGDLLQECKSAMGKVFEGYKGGDYMMGENTPVWVASYGCCGLKLIDIDENCDLVTREDDDQP